MIGQFHTLARRRERKERREEKISSGSNHNVAAYIVVPPIRGCRRASNSIVESGVWLLNTLLERSRQRP